MNDDGQYLSRKSRLYAYLLFLDSDAEPIQIKKPLKLNKYQSNNTKSPAH